MPGMDTDVIDTLVGIEPGSALDAIRNRRPDARKQAQASYRALFAPEIARRASARRSVSRWPPSSPACTATRRPRRSTPPAWPPAGHRAELRRAIDAAIAAAKGQGPYGSYPAGPLSREDTAGPTHRVAAETRDVLGSRLAAAFDHMHLLVFHPRDAAPAALQALLDAGWSTTDIVTLSQIAAFLSFQIRVVAGLRALAGAA